VEGSPRVSVELWGGDGALLASKRLEGVASDWRKITTTLRPNATDAQSWLNVIVEGRGTVDLDMVSLFPRKTWMNRPGGLRADLVQMLADMEPGFFRFPGGCIVEGSHLDRRYQWKNTIGPVEERPLLINRWNYEFKHRPAPDYYQTFGLGFFEYFQLCEDIEAEPLPILSCGIACQFNSGELVPLDELDPYVQDALDLIEFANGPATSEWGGKRAAMGHPEPFRMKYLGVGNEQWGPQFIERYEVFHKILKEKHPEIILISGSGPAPMDDRYDYLWPELRRLEADVVDEHCYANPNWFFTGATRYDDFDRDGPKVFMGEYAAQSDRIVSVINDNNLECALSEAAFMTGMERNADVVHLSSYAPLFGHIDAWQWRPNMIWCDNLRVMGTPNYHVQKLFSRNRGDVVLPISLDPYQPSFPAAGRIGLGTHNTSAEFKDVQVTRGGETLFAGAWEEQGGDWSMEGGNYRQNQNRGDATAYAGDPSWSDYTLTLKARKLRGSEGFVVIVRNASANTHLAWNLGGWGNTQHGIQELLGVQPRIVAQVPGSIEEDRWYDVKIELSGTGMKCHLDGELIQTAEVPGPTAHRFFASAVLDKQANEVVIKVVNAEAQPAEVEIRLPNATLAGTGRAMVLSGEQLRDVNTLDDPLKLHPVERTVNGISSNFRHAFPPRSLTVLRLPIAR